MVYASQIVAFIAYPVHTLSRSMIYCLETDVAPLMTIIINILLTGSSSHVLVVCFTT